MKLKKYLFKSVTSTNDIAIKKINEGIISGIIVAKKQTKGRGRYGNKWIYIKNNLFMSIFFNLNNNINLKKLTSISCKIVKRSLLKLINKKITIKKPNDLLINKKKVCGILQETVFFKNKKFAIIGIGLNINRSPIIDNYPTTHLNFFSKKKITSFKIYNEIKKNFENYLNN
jgi:birA, biotin-[acetyl-CoA-carboxylase] ligase region